MPRVNDRAGVKMPDIAVSLATFKGYGLRRPGFVAGDQNSLSSSQLAFPLLTATQAGGRPAQERAGAVWHAHGVTWPRWAPRSTSWSSLVWCCVAGTDDASDHKARAQMQSLQPDFSLLP